ncbi:hypothetical protein TorRG33x02_244490 [Trema orientale]|uniref:Uncharacterized protein n=1 Tax=Trema orientale TaxID=63057 RepID=A0A2P5DRB6_TREOI|nr:hypothetical protein TorRG33x02_244490 [Trema orientale]
MFSSFPHDVHGSSTVLHLRPSASPAITGIEAPPPQKHSAELSAPSELSTAGIDEKYCEGLSTAHNYSDHLRSRK